MNPYFERYESRLSHRRPIVERVPECAPTGLFLDTFVGVSGRRHWHLFLPPNNNFSIETTDAAALALCQRSALEWACAQPGFENGLGIWKDSEWHVIVEGRRMRGSHTCDGPNLDRCLVDALHYIADELGIAP
jgi:hypothetical protein